MNRWKSLTCDSPWPAAHNLGSPTWITFCFRKTPALPSLTVGWARWPVPVAMSMAIGGISHVRHAFDPINEVRDMQLDGSPSGSLLIGHIKHDDGDMPNAIKQSALISNRPGQFNILQQAESLEYEASEPIGTITYGGQSGEQRNAIALGLPASFTLVLGDTVGYVAEGPMESIQVQMTNATVPLTMDGDTCDSGSMKTLPKRV